MALKLAQNQICFNLVRVAKLLPGVKGLARMTKVTEQQDRVNRAPDRQPSRGCKEHCKGNGRN